MAVFLRSLFILTLFLGGCQQGPDSQSQPDPTVGTFPAQMMQVSPRYSYSGRTVAYNTAEVRPQVGGIILERKFEEGAFVKKGDILYEIDPAPYIAELNRVEAVLKSRENTSKRYKKLLNSNSVGYQDYEDIYFKWQEAIAELAIARLNLEYCSVKAPLSGKIGKSNVSIGALTLEGQQKELAVIEQLNPINVDINPPAVDLMLPADANMSKWLKAEVTLELENGTPYPLKGQIRFIDNHVNTDTNTIGLRAEFDSPNFQLLPGMYVKASFFEKEARQHIIIPQQALFRDSMGSPQVWLVKPDNTVEIREVKLGSSLGNSWIILSGLLEGDQLICEGLLRARPGLKVEPRVATGVEIKLDLQSGS